MTIIIKCNIKEYGYFFDFFLLLHVFFFIFFFIVSDLAQVGSVRNEPKHRRFVASRSLENEQLPAEALVKGHQKSQEKA